MFLGLQTSLFCFLLLLPWSMPAEGKKPVSGQQIYRQQCARCHGRDGNGVNGKYDGPLHGTRSLEKLAGYIERNMPDDKPGTCSKEDAAAVARYIYDAFYSAEARLRNNPARVELVRL